MLKHSKKVVSVPEAEYKALLSMLAGGDHSKLEKVESSEKIKKILADPKLSQLEKSVKYNSAFKKRRKIAKIIENKPQRVFFDAQKEKPSPTSGITPAEAPKSEVQEAQQNGVEQQEPEAATGTPKKSSGPTISDYESIVNKKFFARMKTHVEANKDKFGINDKGEIIPNRRVYWEPIDSSDYLPILKFMVGDKKDLNSLEIKAAKALIGRLAKDEHIKELIEQSKGQEGQGRYMIQLKEKKHKANPKSKGLVRFKPKLWTKAEQ